MSAASEASGVVLTPEQQAVLDAVRAGEQWVLVTGRAGTGKSTLLAHLSADSERRMVVCAPNGVAALNVGGQTVHSLFRLPIGVVANSRIFHDSQTRTLLGNIDTLVIDEVSMVNADLMDAVDRALREGRGDPRPFGGVQVVLFGDPYQLAPVPGDPEERAYFADHYRSSWFFDAHVWEQAPLTVFELREIHRQRDDRFRTLLTAVRHNRVTAEMAKVLNDAGARPLPDPPPITLASRNDIVTSTNTRALAALPGQVKTAKAEVNGDFGGRAFPADEQLRLKVGARVMFLRNDPDQRWVNGSIGEVVRIDSTVRVEVDGEVHEVLPTAWERFRYSYNAESKKLDKDVVAEFRQFPLRLAWGVTIHKSQGQTYDAAHIDLGARAFSPGQTYVALSRLRSLDGLYLSRPLRPPDIIVDADVDRFLREQRRTTPPAATAEAPATR